MGTVHMTANDVRAAIRCVNAKIGRVKQAATRRELLHLRDVLADWRPDDLLVQWSNAVPHEAEPAAPQRVEDAET